MYKPMAHKVFLLEPNDEVEQLSLTKWYKEIGDPVAEGDSLFEAETEKAVIELESEFEGFLLYRKEHKERVFPGCLVAVIGKKDEDIQSLLGEEGKISPSKPIIQGKTKKELG